MCRVVVALTGQLEDKYEGTFKERMYNTSNICCTHIHIYVVTRFLFDVMSITDVNINTVNDTSPQMRPGW